MPFNIALSGIRAASSDLDVTGNNIANASTTGFKSSRVEFGDIYAGSILGSTANTPGSGVSLQNIRQQFSQGNRNFTDNSLDLAINGTGFFVTSNGGDRQYTRAGAFGLDDDGFMVSNVGARLQGFAADEDGNINGTLSDLQVDVSVQPPRQTTLSEARFNLDSNQPVLESIGTEFTTDGAVIGIAQQGLQEATSTTTDVGNITTPINFAADPTTFQLELTGSSPSSGNGTVNITLDASTANSVQDIANLINSEIFGAPSPINVQAVANGSQLLFQDLTEGVSSTITVSGVTGTNDLSTALAGAPASVAGIAEVTNGYLAQTLEFEGPDGDVFNFTSERDASAAQTASEMNALAGITASAQTNARIIAGSFDNSNNNFTLNGVTLTSTTLDGLANEINGLGTSQLAGIRAEVNSTGDLEITSRVGADLRFGFGGSQPPGTLDVIGRTGTGIQTVNTNTEDVVVGGSLTIQMEEGYSLLSAEPSVGNLFSPLTDDSFSEVAINAFDPADQGTFNHSTTSTVYDSLGNPHTLEQYFVRQPYDTNDPSTSPNHWMMYVQVDGQNVGDPDPTLPVPENTQPTMASFNVHFNSDGSLNEDLTDPMLISNWTPNNDDGSAAGALGPLNVLQGGQLPVTEPPSSSNFEISLDGTTQFGSNFGVERQDQNGYTTGRLSGVDIADDGIIFARFTNGEAQVLGQVALANFNNIEGLKPVGDTSWVQTADSGEPVVGAPGSAQLGIINSGALEESNVDLSTQLVNLIIAQRNFQASSKTIETANQVTQTIINLR
ncbi:flagellar hook-basal body complex protein [Marinimicrobium sp. C6131]|uniref:flagellar hook-basal body complex protein n=1 Tax=Marinimicrobium sp. C6131 TaxID=3022676 RepID=UPI00223D1E1F|nr:flagellar hook-basal body complex protein [Marinimicrobium sp. C6131]UZJ45197.1 flagellar hook-basal body complex protein [Marinimicrobium sp. C6131]